MSSGPSAEGRLARTVSFGAAVLLLVCGAGAVLAASQSGFIRFEGIAGDGGDAGHPGAFASPFLDVGNLGSGAAAGKGGGGTGSVWLRGGGPGFDALVRACLARQTFASAEVSLGAATYVLEGVSLESVFVYGGSVSSGAATGKGPIAVNFRFASFRDAHAPKPGATSRVGSVGAAGVLPLQVAPTATPVRPK